MLRTHFFETKLELIAIIIKYLYILKLGNHDQPRIATRVGKKNVNLVNALYLLVGGTPITYYGEEIGMEDLTKELLKFEDCKDERGKRHGVGF
jgi:glycosidase